MNRWYPKTNFFQVIFFGLDFDFVGVKQENKSKNQTAVIEEKQKCHIVFL